MREIGLTDDQLAALNDGEAVIVRSANLGPSGHNGEVTIHPPGEHPLGVR